MPHVEEGGHPHGEEEDSGTFKKPKKSLIDKLKLPVCLHSRTGMCKHQFGCIENTIRGMSKMFWITFAVKTVIGNLLLLIKPAKLIKSL